VEEQPPDGRRAKERAAEALETARRALETAPDDAAAHIWYGQAVGTHAKVFDPGLGQGRVCNVLVQHWDRAVELAPQDPLPYHLLGSFAFHTSALPWATQSIVRALSPGLRKFTADDAMELLRHSEARMPSPPCPYAVTNRSMLGRLHLRKGQKGEARVWLDKALDTALELDKALDRSAQKAADEARKARAKL
jgi:tetratricopeptide (TPR) repeat protein